MIIELKWKFHLDFKKVVWVYSEKNQTNPLPCYSLATSSCSVLFFPSQWFERWQGFHLEFDDAYYYRKILSGGLYHQHSSIPNYQIIFGSDIVIFILLFTFTIHTFILLSFHQILCVCVWKINIKKVKSKETNPGESNKNDY